MGVDVFFVLSGFLISSLLIGEWGKRGHVSLSNFYARRALRLFPALVVAIAVALFVIAIGRSFKLGDANTHGATLRSFLHRETLPVPSGQQKSSASSARHGRSRSKSSSISSGRSCSFWLCSAAKRKERVAIVLQPWSCSTPLLPGRYGPRWRAPRSVHLCRRYPLRWTATWLCRGVLSGKPRRTDLSQMPLGASCMSPLWPGCS